MTEFCILQSQFRNAFLVANHHLDKHAVEVQRSRNPGIRSGTFRTVTQAAAGAFAVISNPFRLKHLGREFSSGCL
jgi:hypothetical protein